MPARVSERDERLLAKAIPLQHLSECGAIGIQRGMQVLARLGLSPAKDSRIASVHANCGPISVCLLLRRSLSPTPAEARVHKPVGSEDTPTNINFAILSERFIRGLINLNLAWWANPRFLPTEGDLRSLLFPESEVSQIPFGVESLWYDFHNECHSELDFPDCWPRWFDDAHETLCDTRKEMFRRSVLSAIDFLWLHELGHIFCGHFSSIQPWETLGPAGGLGALNQHRDSHSGKPERRPADLRRAFEIEADSWAVKQMISQLDTENPNATSVFLPGDEIDESSSSPIGSQEQGDLLSQPGKARGLYQMRAALVGVLSALVSWDYYRLLAGGVDTSLAIHHSTYPPLWFRVDSCLLCYDSALRNQPCMSAGDTVRASFAQLHFTVTQLSNVHPFVAVCLGTPLDPARRLLRDRILDNARATSAAHWRENEESFNYKVRCLLRDSPGRKD